MSAWVNGWLGRMSFTLLLGLLALPVLATTQVLENLPGGGRMHILVPDGWKQGDPLILYNHGFSFNNNVLEKEPEPAPNLPIQNLWLSRGYALAAGSYRDRGWAVFDMKEHQLEIMSEFKQRFGKPGEIMVLGGSFGGVVSAKTAEYLQAAGEPVSMVYTQCAPLAGSRSWDLATRYKQAYDAVCKGEGGAEFPRSSQEPAWAYPYDRIPENVNFDDIASNSNLRNFAARINQCTGIPFPAWSRSSGQKARLKKLMDTFELTDEKFFILNMAYATFALSDVIFNPNKLNGLVPSEVRGSDNQFKDDAELSAKIEGSKVDPLGRLRLGYYTNHTGKNGFTHWLHLHTDKDELVGSDQLDYFVEALDMPGMQRRKAKFGWAMVKDDKPAHCDFSQGEYMAGFDYLRHHKQLERDITPPGPSLSQLSRELKDGFAKELNKRCNEFYDGNPDGADARRCRFDADLDLKDYDKRLQPYFDMDDSLARDQLAGTWTLKELSGDGMQIDVVEDESSAVVAWYTYPEQGATHPQQWLYGYGTLVDFGAAGVMVDGMYQYTGPAFGTPPSPSTAKATGWGKLALAVDPSKCQEAGRRFFPMIGAYERGFRPDEAGGKNPAVAMERVTRDGTLNPGKGNCLAEAGGSRSSDMAKYSGNWYRGPSQSGDGVVFQSQPMLDAAGDVHIAMWYTYDTNGQPAWLLGTSATEENGKITFNITRPTGPYFAGIGGKPMTHEPWGTMTLTFKTCSTAEMKWTPSVDGWAAGQTSLVRLTGQGSLSAPDCRDD